MPIDLPALVSRWTRSTNRRVLFEELLRALGWLAIAAALGLALHQLPQLLARVRISWPQWMPTSQTMAYVAYGLGGTALVMVTVRAIVRIRRRRIDTLGMARRIDAQQGTDDLVATALAVASGTVAGSPEVQQVVRNKATAAVAEVKRPLPSFALPGRVLVGATAATAIAVALPFALDELAELTISDAVAATDDADANAEDEVTPLDEQTKERIDKAIEQLEKYERSPALRREAKEQLAAAREHLQRALDDPKQAAAELSRAEQALRQLAKEARRQGLFDKQELSNMSNEELTDAMSQAMEEGQHDTAAEMGSELSRRMESASEPELRKLADAFRKRFPPTASPKPPGRDPEKKPGETGESGEKKPGETGESGEKKPGETGESGEKKPGEGEGKRESAEERRERWRKALEQMAEDMERGESGLSSSEMRRLAEELAEEADRGNGSMGRSLDETLSEIHGARRRHLDELGRERGEGKSGEGKSPGMGKPGEGKGPGMGKPGEGKGPGKGPGMGKPGEGKGPGMGEGKGEGKGSGEGKSGEGKGGEGSGEGPPSGKPGPGGGLGRTPYGMDVLPPGAITPGERVDVPSGGPPKGAVRIIERVASGPGRDTKEYADIHHEYSAVAEAAVRREEIPLTRRDYIRNYFQAVRPQ